MLPEFIAVNKSHEFLLNVGGLFYIFRWRRRLHVDASYFSMTMQGFNLDNELMFFRHHTLINKQNRTEKFRQDTHYNLDIDSQIGDQIVYRQKIDRTRSAIWTISKIDMTRSEMAIWPYLCSKLITHSCQLLKMKNRDPRKRGAETEAPKVPRGWSLAPAENEFRA